jgi:hypothetical protein
MTWLEKAQAITWLLISDVFGKLSTKSFAWSHAAAVRASKFIPNAPPVPPLF